MARGERTRNGGKLTEAQFWGKVRSALRREFAWWTPANEAMNAARRKNTGTGRHRYEYQCSHCNRWFVRKDVQADHIEPVGSLKSLGDMAGFLERLTPENPSAFQCVCKQCHKAKTRGERKR